MFTRQINRCKTDLSIYLPVLWRLNSTEVAEVVPVVHSVVLPASDKMRLPCFCNESFEPFPFTGWSRLAIQTTVAKGDDGLVNHTARAKALYPTA